ncbi:pyridine nucleotide-disulfide oxidoreductase [Marinobacter halodurans]|uniref:Pyridine nucleotide-disulfide oxidoreductase n=1 Tax=Marinobacter halodurans TaxID=2528979 RepID=A0ABY1ZEB0_9GAMM|nr:FAD-dependent oxidoreductase [Marinobacter halodurans]TBW48305.1 pyridine nucleotide-disulfide oxidoreductase [Marinobacter halodurans]
MKTVVMIGAGQASLSCAAKLRAKGFDGEIILIGDEPKLPYQRPPLSKAYLLGKVEAERLLLRPQSWYEQQQIRLVTATKVMRIDRNNKAVELSDGRVQPYDALVLATGSAARNLPQSMTRSMSGIHTIRDLNDIENLRPELDVARHMVVIGGGYIGLEMAAVAKGLGLEVDVIEAAPNILGRVASKETADYILELHQDQGVTFRVGEQVKELSGDGKIESVVLGNGEAIPTDIVVAGIGAMPRVELAEQAGLEVANGILVNAFGQTSDPDIYAIGDCACYRLQTGDVRLESVGNAIDTGELVAGNILGEEMMYEPKPWFWSDQFDMKLQIAGQISTQDRITVRDVEGEGRSHWYHRDGQLVAVDALNAPRAYLIGRKMVLNGLSPTGEQLANCNQSLKEIFDSL